MQVLAVGRRDRLSVLEPAGDDEPGVEDRHREHEQRQEQRDSRCRLQEALDGNGRKHEPEQHRPRVAHEDPRRIEVVAEEAEAGAEDDRRDDRRLRLSERERDHGERRARDRAHACGEPVEPVEEVDHVHDRDDPDHGQRLADPRRQLVDADEREREVVDPDPEATGITAAPT